LIDISVILPTSILLGYLHFDIPFQIWGLQCLESITLGDCEELKCLFSMETHRSLPELMYLCVYNCDEFEQIVAPNEELVELPNAASCIFQS
jgi:hypothetical protein